ncbi:pilus assembly protein TadG-related protein [Phytoactinopolyspora limicola]|uniref:pilus assembly protein TadG-related protein n=1 Tax=Phytoactinopolyspora limicola TaxID=2715536 RepID=UPI00140E2E69|nr:pilus assembly protein TadG-related protein [Phytoactinopolyspora limicola]
MTTGHTRRGRWVPDDHESGQITLLIIGLALVLGLVVATVASASNAFLVRRSLSSWTDGAVTVAAQQVAHEDLYGGAPVSVLPISPVAAHRAVVDYAARHDLAGRFDSFAVAQVTVDRGSGQVTVEFTASAPLLPFGHLTQGRTEVQITAKSTALVPID